MKIELDEFPGFLRSRSPFPLFDGFHRGFCQQRIAAHHLHYLQFSAGRDYDFHLDGPVDSHFAGKFWIYRRHPVHHFPFSVRLFLSQTKGWRERGYSQREHYTSRHNEASYGWFLHYPKLTRHRRRCERNSSNQAVFLKPALILRNLPRRERSREAFDYLAFIGGRGESFPARSSA